MALLTVPITNWSVDGIYSVTFPATWYYYNNIGGTPPLVINMSASGLLRGRMNMDSFEWQYERILWTYSQLSSYYPHKQNNKALFNSDVSVPGHLFGSNNGTLEGEYAKIVSIVGESSLPQWQLNFTAQSITYNIKLKKPIDRELYLAYYTIAQDFLWA